MEESIRQSGTELAPAMRGNAAADLHAYRGGQRMARDEGSPSRRMSKVRETLRNVDEKTLAKALGWFSVALGVAEVVAPRKVGRAIGINDRDAHLLRAMGLREIASGVGILTQPKRTGWLWSRVAGDAIDLALLGAAAGSKGSSRTRLAAATAAVAGVAALDIYCSQRSRNGAAGDAAPAREPVREMIVVNASAEECYRTWRDFEGFPRFMKHVEAVRQSGKDQWHWVVKAPGGATVEWDARITSDEPNRLLAWETLPGADVHNSGMVRFDDAPGGRGTRVRVEMSYVPPAGPIGAVAAKVTGEAPGQQVREDLRRFKQIMETGEIATTEGQASGRRGVVHRLVTKARGQ